VEVVVSETTLGNAVGFQLKLPGTRIRGGWALAVFVQAGS